MVGDIVGDMAGDEVANEVVNEVKFGRDKIRRLIRYTNIHSSGNVIER